MMACSDGFHQQTLSKVNIPTFEGRYEHDRIFPYPQGLLMFEHGEAVSAKNSNSLMG
jgi:hypothetical protein